jgi:hypothetical protein
MTATVGVTNEWLMRASTDRSVFHATSPVSASIAATKGSVLAFVKNGRASAAVHRRVLEFGIGPLQLSIIGCQARHPVSTEVHEHGAITHDRGGTGVAVLRVNRGRLRESAHFAVPEHFARFGIERQRPQG